MASEWVSGYQPVGTQTFATRATSYKRHDTWESTLPRIVHTIEEIEAVLRRGETPQTDNSDALVELGFVRSSPHLVAGYESTLWERSRDHAQRAASGLRLFVRERAVLVEKSAVPLSA